LRATRIWTEAGSFLNAQAPSFQPRGLKLSEILTSLPHDRHQVASFRLRKADFVCYSKGAKSSYAIVMIGDVNPSVSRNDVTFTDMQIGHISSMTQELLQHEQPWRNTLY
jgi:hypothetical protein